MVRSDVLTMIWSNAASVFTLLALSSALAAPRPDFEEYHVVQRRAALVLDRLLVAMERALHEDAYRARSTRHAAAEGPRVAALRVAPLRLSPPHNPNSRSLRGHSGSSIGRAVQCYFNAITCF